MSRSIDGEDLTTLLPFKIRQIQYFLAVAELLHFTRAAERMYVSQPTLSLQIAELEQTLGTPLFDRLGREVRLTEAGEMFRRSAMAALKQLEAGQHAIAELHGMKRGELRIGVSQSFVRHLLPPLVAEFHQKYPKIFLSVSELAAKDIEKRLAKGELDLGIAYAPPFLEETELDPILEERLLLVVGPLHPFAGREEVRLRELNDTSLILFERSYSTRELLDRLFEKEGVNPTVVAESNSVAVMLGLAHGSQAATILLESSLTNDEQCDVIPLIEPSPRRTSAILWSRFAFRSAAALTFAKLVKERSRPLKDLS